MKYIYTVFTFFVLTLCVSAQNFDWEWQNPKPQGNNINDVAALTTSRLIAAGDAGTILISNDGGQTWAYDQVDTTGLELLALSFVNSTTGFACGDGGLILKTVDGGASWSVLNTGVTSKLYDIDFIDADSGYAVGSAGVILKTTNGGTSWSAILSPITNQMNSVTVKDAANIFIGAASASATQLLSRSTDYGVTWENITPAGLTSPVYNVVFGDNNTGYAFSTEGKVYKTTDGGASFAAITSAGSDDLYGAYFSDANHGYVAGENGSVMITSDGGTSWVGSTINKQDVKSIVPSSLGLVAVGSAGTVAASADNAATWSLKFNSVTQELLRKVVFLDENTGFACGGSSQVPDSLGFILKTTDGGTTWTKMDYNFKFQVYSMALASANVWFAGTGDNKMFKSTDAGATWALQTQPITGTTHDFNEIAFVNENYGFAVGATGKIIKTTDGGANWTNVTSPFGTSGIYEIHAIDTLTAVACGLSAKAFKTTDGGATWTALTTGIAGTFFGMEFLNDSFGLITGYSSGATSISVTRDGGDTWTPVATPATIKGSVWSAAIVDTTHFWVADINGNIAFTNDGGTTWTAAKSPSGNGLYDIATAGGKMWLVGQGGTIVKGFTDSTVPVELTAFGANIKNNKVVLVWQTATETNNRGFDVERKVSGSSWKNIAFVPGKGTTSETSNYLYEDAGYASGKVYYRLKQVDYNGTSEYTNAVEVDVVSPVKFELSQNYPNPFNPSTTIKYSVPQKENVTLKVFNVLGKEIAVLVNGVQESGSYSVKFDASVYSSGVYFYELTSGANRISRKMILIK